MSLLSRLFARRPASTTAQVLPLSDGPLYAVGDVHGCLDRYIRLEEAILADARGKGESSASIVTLGDYIDRGPDSAGMLDRLCASPPPGITRHCLRGNHEQMFAQFLAAPDPRASWLDMGGRETLASYGLYSDQTSRGTRHLALALDALIPQDHRDFLEGLPFAFANSTHFLCHAGVDPARALDAQTTDTLLWIRQPFLGHDARLSHIVVHGHTPVVAPDIRDGRINVDTGAYSGNPLSAVRIHGATAPQILQIAASGD